jgi:hypothetical protein
MLASWSIDPPKVTLRGERVTIRAEESEPERRRDDTVERNQVVLGILRAMSQPVSINEVTALMGGSRQRIERAMNALHVANLVRPIPSPKKGVPVLWVAL